MPGISPRTCGRLSQLAIARMLSDEICRLRAVFAEVMAVYQQFNATD